MFVVDRCCFALLPREASQHFGDCLLPYIEDLLALSKGSGNVRSAISNAVICQQREMAQRFRYISHLRQAVAPKKVLVLGAGYVSAPVVDFLSSKSKQKHKQRTNIKNVNFRS